VKPGLEAHRPAPALTMAQPPRPAPEPRGALALLAALALLVPALAGCADGGRSADHLYRTQCARCHADDGKGDRRSVGLYPNIDLTSSPMVRAGARGRFLVYRRISEGYGAMPAFGHRLEAEEMGRLVDYVLRLPQGKAGR
jgi:mono/diheme cytochrome c family protein